MAVPERTVIVGGGLAGSRCAFELRAAGYAGAISLVGAEPHAPYDRPPLSKQFLLGRCDEFDLILHPTADYAAADIDLMIGQAVEHLDIHTRRVTLSGGTQLEYTSLVLATGARPRTIPAWSPARTGVQVLRTIEDAVQLRAVAATGARVVVVGAGLIGSEIASTLTVLGASVVVVDPEALPMRRIVGPVVGTWLHQVHRDAGVEFRLGALPTELLGSVRATGVRLDSGEILAAEHVVVGIGAVPRIELAQAAGLPTRTGILTDSCGATDVPGVYAVGDAAESFVTHLDRHAHVEHRQAASRQARAVAQRIAGTHEEPDAVPWFWSDQAGLNLQMVGWPDPRARTVIRGALEARDFIAFQVNDAGSVVAAVGCGRGREIRRTAALVRSGISVDTAALTDDTVDVRQLTPAG